MNCSESQELLQHRLDGERIPDRAGLDRHLAECAECRSLHAVAARLEEGLQALLPPMPPAQLPSVIVSAALSDYSNRRRRRRLWLVGSAAAAAVLIAVLDLALVHWRGVQPGPTSPGPVVATQPEKGVRDNVAEAGSAVVSLTLRTADETREQTRLLTEALPMGTPLPALEANPPGLDAPVQTVLQEAGQRVSSGLEPVTSSARRAFSMFLREAPGRPVSQ
jgi:predicted anti-sigma-YlaC factor YlaD